jgi:hypothetical protein
MKTLLLSMALFGIAACGAIEEVEDVVMFPYEAYKTYENREEYAEKFDQMAESFRLYFNRIFLDVALSLQWLEYGQVSLQQLIDSGRAHSTEIEKLVRKYCNGELCSGTVVENELYLWCDGAEVIEDCWFVKPTYLVLSTGGIR